VNRQPSTVNPTRELSPGQPLELPPMSHPFKHGHLFFSPGCHFSYRVIGSCCRLFDRETLPYPCCRIEWRGKEPSWRRIGKRFIADLATRNSPSYSVEIVGQAPSSEPIVLTLYSVKLPQPLKEWWFSLKPSTSAMTDLMSPESAEEIKIEG
jgi:hypothetical protein